MKQLLSVLLFLPLFVRAQWPLPCFEYNSSNTSQLESFEGELSVGCFTIQEGEEPNISIHNNRNRTFHVDEANINSFFEIKNVGDGEFNIDLNPTRSFECAWIEPANYFVPRYEKVEWGVKLPDDIQTRIESWILNQSHDIVHAGDINPFDPEQIRIEARIWYVRNDGTWTTEPDVIDGFYYIPFHRDISSADKNDWDWVEDDTEYKFRVRWAPIYATTHRVVLSFWTPETSEQYSAFYFDSWAANPRNSFVKVSDNGHYFVTEDKDLFFPTGVNLWENTFNCTCDYEDAGHYLASPDNSLDEVPLSASECVECYIKGTDDYCAFLKRKKLQGAYPTKDWDNIRNMGVPLPGFLKLHERIDELKESGGNSFRMHFSPATIDIEFEKMNNYYDRQYQAWEFDKVLEHCRENDMRIDLCMQIHNAVTILKYFRNTWDWNNYDNNGNPDPSDLGWCYWRELGLDPEKPLDFFTNQQAIENYKKKIRYIIARWGYSTSIYTMELFSEINNVGIGEYSTADDTNGNHRPSGYDIGLSEFQDAIENWHAQMAFFIKQDVRHQRHCIGIDYAGREQFKESGGYIGDFSFYLDNIDFLSFSNYKQDIKRLEDLSKSWTCFFMNASNYPAETLINYPHAFMGYFANNSDEHYQASFVALRKPVMLGESGIMDNYFCDNESGKMQIYSQFFTGLANSGYLWHGQSRKKSWEYFENINSFWYETAEQIIDFSADLISPLHLLANDDRVEIVGLKSNLSTTTIGYVQNRTKNWYTNYCNLFFDQYSPVLGDFPDDLGDDNFYYFTSVISPNITISDMKNFKWYKIKYFNETSIAPFLVLSKRSSLVGNLNIELPDMHDSAKGYFFSIELDYDKINSGEEVNDLFEGSLDFDESCLKINRIGERVVILEGSDPLGAIGIFDSRGSLVLLEENYSSKQQLDLGSLESGVYILKTQSCAKKIVLL